MRSVRQVLAGCVALGCWGLVGLGAPAAYADGTDCSQTRADTGSEPTTTPSGALMSLQIDRTHELLARRGIEPGQGQTVAVLDSGVRPNPRVVEVSLHGTTPTVDDYQGTALAAVIAGPVADGPDASEPRVIGIAPATRLIDVQVYDSLTPAEGEVGPDGDRVVAGLRWVAQNSQRLGIDIANVSLGVGESDALRAAVTATVEAGVIVVASAGDLPAGDAVGSERYFDEDGALRPGIDARDDIWPAGYDDVVAVSATAPEGADAALSVLQNSQIDIAVPTADGVGLGLDGQPCQLPGVSSRIAAAEVSGILALLKSAYPKETNDQLLARLYDTATGSGSATTGGAGVDPTNDLLTGAGIAQPVEALLRPLSPEKDGSVESVDIAAEDVNASVPQTPPDVLASIREDAVWFGLLAGGLLAAALLLRPVLARRR